MAYGTYSPETGKHWQIKQKVTRRTIFEHLKGIKPYGFYPLVENRTLIGAVDFDDANPELPLQFISRAEHYDIQSYLELSKSKGFHVWMFFPKEGIIAQKVRAILRFILDEIEAPDIEVFPKQVAVNRDTSLGNFINAPLFGKFVLEGRTVFVQPNPKLEPYPDQWSVLESVVRISESHLDEIIEVNTIKCEKDEKQYRSPENSDGKISNYSLPLCIRRILDEGVTFDQRVSCFRIAVHLKRIGIPYDLTVAALKGWRVKNRPIDNKEIITPDEIEEQAGWAYKKNYTGFGCQEPVIQSFCDTRCPVKLCNRR